MEKPDGEDYGRRCAVVFLCTTSTGSQSRIKFVSDASPGRSLRRKELPSFCMKGKYDAHPHCDLNGTV